MCRLKTSFNMIFMLNWHGKGSSAQVWFDIYRDELSINVGEHCLQIMSPLSLILVSHHFYLTSISTQYQNIQFQLSDYWLVKNKENLPNSNKQTLNLSAACKISQTCMEIQAVLYIMINFSFTISRYFQRLEKFNRNILHSKILLNIIFREVQLSSSNTFRIGDG